MLICLILYVAYKLAQGHDLADALKLRRHPGPHHGVLTEMPITRTQRFSVRSSYHRSRVSLQSSRSRKSMTVFTKDLSLSSTAKSSPRYWTDSTPLPTPTVQSRRKLVKTEDYVATPSARTGTFLLDATPDRKLVRPEMVHVKGDARASQVAASKAETRLTPLPTITTRPVSPLLGDSFEWPSAKINADRWSWTNSEAPSTPRFTIDCTPSGKAGPKPKLKRMNSLTSYQMDRIEEDHTRPTKDDFDHKGFGLSLGSGRRK